MFKMLVKWLKLNENLPSADSMQEVFIQAKKMYTCVLEKEQFLH